MVAATFRETARVLELQGEVLGRSLRGFLSAASTGVSPSSFGVFSLLGAREWASEYQRWWLELIKSNPVHVLVETGLIVCIFLVFVGRNAQMRAGKVSKKGELASERKEEEEEE